MAGEQGNDLKDLSYEELLNLKEEMEDEEEDKYETQQENMQDWEDRYGYPEPEQRFNPHSFLHKAAFESNDTIRTTFLAEGELGKPLFTVRTMLDLRTIAIHHLDPVLEKFGLTKENNIISSYFTSKLRNVTDSGMSNRGFAMNLNVTQKRDLTKKKSRDASTQNLKGQQ